MLVPHLCRAVALNRALTKLHAENKTTSAAMNIAAISLGERGLVIAASESAEEILREGDGLTSRNRRLSASDPLRNALLQELIQAALETACKGESTCSNGSKPGEPPGTRKQAGSRSWQSFVIPRSNSKHALQLVVLPFRSSKLLLQDRPCVLIFIMDPEKKTVPVSEALQTLYGLTPAEARLTELLVAGHELNHCAELLGNTVPSTRVRLKAAMRKMNVSRQTELMRLLVGFPKLVFQNWP